LFTCYPDTPYLHFTSTSPSDSARTVALASVFCACATRWHPWGVLTMLWAHTQIKKHEYFITKITGAKSKHKKVYQTGVSPHPSNSATSKRIRASDCSGTSKIRRETAHHNL